MSFLIRWKWSVNLISESFVYPSCRRGKNMIYPVETKALFHLKSKVSNTKELQAWNTVYITLNIKCLINQCLQPQGATASDIKGSRFITKYFNLKKSSIYNYCGKSKIGAQYRKFSGAPKVMQRPWGGAPSYSYELLPHATLSLVNPIQAPPLKVYFMFRALQYFSKRLCISLSDILECAWC